MKILVTGATRGIGKTIADVLGKDNEIFATGRNEELLKCYKNYIACDLSQKNDLEELGEYIHLNKIDVLVNNAGEYIYSLIDSTDYEQIKELISINLVSPLYLISQAVT